MSSNARKSRRFLIASLGVSQGHPRTTFSVSGMTESGQVFRIRDGRLTFFATGKPGVLFCCTCITCTCDVVYEAVGTPEQRHLDLRHLTSEWLVQMRKGQRQIHTLMMLYNHQDDRNVGCRPAKLAHTKGPPTRQPRDVEDTDTGNTMRCCHKPAGVLSVNATVHQ